jgi:hypothetical protein
MITIVNRGSGEKVAELFTKEGVTFNLLMLGKGTSDLKFSDFLGLGETEKAVLFSTMPYEISRILLRKLNKETDLNKPGHGIAFTIPVGSVCGIKTASCLAGVSQPERGGNNMSHIYDHDLIVAVTNRGYADEVMKSAKAAKATGGTALHARRVGVNEAEKFFGVPIQPEKEVILILTQSEYKQAIMQAITAKTGLQTEAKTAVFSLPVNGVAGLSDIMPEED